MNETSIYKKEDIKLHDNYDIILHNKSVGIIYKRDYNINKICTNVMDEYTLITKIRKENDNKTMILIAAYSPPKNFNLLRNRNIPNIIKYIIEKYNNVSFILYGDLNIKRKEFKSIIEDKLSNIKNIKFHYKKGTFEVTRCRADSANNINYNYIDYMISYNIEVINFNLIKPPGISDHVALQLIVGNEEFKEVSLNKQIFFSFRRCNDDKEEITNKLKKILETPNINIEEIGNLINNLKEKYKSHVKTPKGPFQWVSYYNKLVEYINDYKNNNRIKNKFNKKKEINVIKLKKKEFEKVVINFNEDEFTALLSKIKVLQLDNKFKEFFLLSKFYTDINKKVTVLDNLLIKEDDEEVLTFDSNEIYNKMYDKYKFLFKDSDYKVNYVVGEEKFNFNENIIERELKKLKKDKGVSWDYIPHNALINILKEDGSEDNDNSESIEKKEIILNNIKRIFNEILYSNNKNVEEFTMARLIGLNKNGEGPGQLDAIRPISIYGPIFKLLERCLFTDLYKTIVPRLNINQTGFIGVLGTEINLMKLREKVFKLYNEGNNNIFITFIDFKSAYDSVSHKLLFKKLEEQYDIKKGLLNAIIKIYSRAKVRIDPLRCPININCGVLQGSILSPLLFNAFINDLINSLERTAYDVLAYADDVAFICANTSQLKESIKLIKEWSKENEMKVNLNKSGILIIKGNIDNEGYFEENINFLNIISKIKIYWI